MGSVQWEGQGPSKEKRGTVEKLACVSHDHVLGNYAGDLCTSVEGDTEQHVRRGLVHVLRGWRHREAHEPAR